jgi:hypothetical protein
MSFLIGTVPYLEAMAEDMKKATISRALAHIRANTLTPETATALWMEVWAAHEVVNRVKKRAGLTGVPTAKTEATING